MLSFGISVLFLAGVGLVSEAASVGRISSGRDLDSRATSATICPVPPLEVSCASLVNICVDNVVGGRTPSTAFWSDRVCVAAATCASVGHVLDVACCAGVCRQATDMASLDYSNIYFGMVGNCAFQPGGCSLKWQPFVDWFYGTIQETGTNQWPASGDIVLGWWAQIATWTGFCAGTNCVNGAIPYLNFNDWFHYSSRATFPGTTTIQPPTTAWTLTISSTSTTLKSVTSTSSTTTTLKSVTPASSTTTTLNSATSPSTVGEVTTVQPSTIAVTATPVTAL